MPTCECECTEVQCTVQYKGYNWSGSPLWKEAQQEVRQHCFVDSYIAAYIQVQYRIIGVHPIDLTVARGSRCPHIYISISISIYIYTVHIYIYIHTYIYIYIIYIYIYYIYIYIYISKVGIRNISPHLRNSAILWTTKTIAELRTKESCGIAIADLQNLTSALPQLSAVFFQFGYFWVPFPLLRMVLKITKNIFRTVCFSGNRKLYLKGH